MIFPSLHRTNKILGVTYAVIAPVMLFWATIALSLFYLAYRYNILFVTDTQIDTRGLFYPRALKHLFFGIYLAEVCMIGMFAVSKAPGPAALMAVFFVFTLLYHLTLNSALGPLLSSLPRSLQIEEELIQARHAPVSDPEIDGAVDNKEANGVGGAEVNGAVQTPKKPNFLLKFLKPWIYADYATLREMVPHEDSIGGIEYADDVSANAYFPPSVTSAAPILWIPEDPIGVSKQEVALTGKVIGISDEGCYLDEKNKIQWDAEGARPPIWTEKIYY